MRKQLTCILFIQVLRALLETGEASGRPRPAGWPRCATRRSERR